MTDLESKILESLKGRSTPSYAVTRSDLVRLTSSPDRANRDAIASLQAQGHPIVSLGKGYWLGTKADVESYTRREWHRIRTLAKKLKGFLPQISEALGQLDLGL